MSNPKVIYWLDDQRDPKVFLNRQKGDTVMWLKTPEEFKNAITAYALPDEIWFDHDLGKSEDGKDCADFLVDFCLGRGLALPEYHSQSQNPVGKQNILSLLDSYNKFYLNNIKNGNLY